MMWIPLRSPKIYSFIFGFHRRVWWPKWTPASSNSFIVISTANFPPQEIDVCPPRPMRVANRSRAEHPYSGELHLEPVPGCQLLAGREFVPPRHAGRDGTEPVNLGAGFKQSPHTTSVTSAC